MREKKLQDQIQQNYDYHNMSITENVMQFQLRFCFSVFALLIFAFVLI